MTGISQAVSINYYDVSYWQNFNQIIDYSFDPKYLLIDRQNIAISNNEYYFVTKNNDYYY